jgi:hypothetical protein
MVEIDSPSPPPISLFVIHMGALNFRAPICVHVVQYRRISSFVTGVGVRIGVKDLIPDMMSGKPENIS